MLCLPLFTRSGYPQGRDLVFTPRQPLRAEAWGIGSGSPRAAPLDLVVALLERIVDGGVLARLLVPLGLVLAAWGARRLVRSDSVWPGLLAGSSPSGTPM